MGEGRRRRGLEQVATVLPGPLRRELGSWEKLVGPTLAAETALVGRDPEGRLRVAVRNEAARHEIVARGGDLVAAFNTQARALGVPLATGVVCWVAASFSVPRLAAREAVPASQVAGAAGATPAALAAAGREGDAAAPGASPRLRETLVRWRACAIARAGSGGAGGGDSGGEG